MIVASWIAFLLVMVSFYYLARKDSNGWLIGTVASAIWVVVSVLSGQWPMALQQAVLIVYGVKNYFDWGNNA